MRERRRPGRTWCACCPGFLAGGTGCGSAASTKQKSPTATVERRVTGLLGYSQRGSSAGGEARKVAGGLDSSSGTKKNRTSLLSVLTRTACARSEKARAHLTQQKKGKPGTTNLVFFRQTFVNRFYIGCLDFLSPAHVSFSRSRVGHTASTTFWKYKYKSTSVSTIDNNYIDTLFFNSEVIFCTFLSFRHE